jgi:ABC-2 type transport system permease protein
MFNRRTLAIIKRELRVRLFSKTFIIMTLLIPTFIFGIIGIQALLYSYSGEENPRLVIISETEDVKENLEKEFSKLPFVKDGSFNITYEVMDAKQFSVRLNELKSSLINEYLTGVVFIPSSSLYDKDISYYSTNPNNISLFNKIKPAINSALVNIYFSGKHFSREDIDFARGDLGIAGFRITEEKVEAEGYGNLIMLFLFSFMLYMSLIFMGQMTMNSVVDEKSSRVVEVLLSSANSTELMTGKILGTAIIGLIQMVIWLIPVIVVISTTWFMLPPDIIFSIDISYVLYFLFNFFIALITYVGLFATVGSIFDNPQDAQSGIWPLIILIMIPFFIALSMQANPQSPIAKVASMLPIASLIVMPSRMTVMEVPLWQFLLSVVVNITVMFFIFPFAGKIYRVGILITGKKPKWSEVVKWIKS